MYRNKLVDRITVCWWDIYVKTNKHMFMGDEQTCRARNHFHMSIILIVSTAITEIPKM